VEAADEAVRYDGYCYDGYHYITVKKTEGQGGGKGIGGFVYDDEEMTVMFRGLRKGLREEDIRKDMIEFGWVWRCTMFHLKRTKPLDPILCNGKCLVEFRTQEAVEKALKLDGTVYQNSLVSVRRIYDDSWKLSKGRGKGKRVDSDSDDNGKARGKGYTYISEGESTDEEIRPRPRNVRGRDTGKNNLGVEEAKAVPKRGSAPKQALAKKLVEEEAKAVPGGSAARKKRRPGFL